MKIFNRQFFKKDPKAEFFSLIPEVADVCPIVPASHFKPSIHINSAKDLSALKKESDYGHVPSKPTAKCSGIYNYIKHGWVMTAWQDIVIKTNGDGSSFEWRTPINSKELSPFMGDSVGFHPASQYFDYVPEHPNTLKTVIKINTPWRCLVPDGYFLMETGLPYTDERRFTTVSGFFSNEYGVSQLNVQLLWHVLNDEVVIKAGTPIAHYMLIPRDQPELVVRAANETDIRNEKITQLEINRKMVSNRTESKCIYSRLFKGRE